MTTKTKDKQSRNRTRTRKFFGMRNYKFENSKQVLDPKTQELVWVEKTPDDKDYQTEEEWKEKIITQFTDYSKLGYSEIFFVFHNRDVEDDETQKQKALHVHFFISFHNVRDYSSILTLTNTEKRNLTRVAQEASVLQYLTHTTQEAIKAKKVRYNVSELYILTNKYENGEDNKGKFVEDTGAVATMNTLQGEAKENYYRLKISGRGTSTKDTSFIKETVDNLAVEVLKGGISAKQVLEMLCITLGNDEDGYRVWYDNKKRFEEAEKEYYNKLFETWKKNGRKFSCIYFSGDSGTGKSTIANNIAIKYLEDCGYTQGSNEADTHKVANAGGRKLDFLSGYNFQRVTLFDDLAPDAFSYYEFLNVFDPNHMSLYSSRFNNKSWFSELALITRSMSITEFIRKVCEKELNKIELKLKNLDEDEKTEEEKNWVSYKANFEYQIARRIAYVIDVTLNSDDYFIFSLKKLVRIKQEKNNKIYYIYDWEDVEVYTPNTRYSDIIALDDDDKIKAKYKKLSNEVYKKFKLKKLLVNDKKQNRILSEKEKQDKENRIKLKMTINEYKEMRDKFNLIRKNCGSEENQIKFINGVLNDVNIFELENKINSLKEKLHIIKMKEFNEANEEILKGVEWLKLSITKNINNLENE